MKQNNPSSPAALKASCDQENNGSRIALIIAQVVAAIIGLVVRRNRAQPAKGPSAALTEAPVNTERRVIESRSNGDRIEPTARKAARRRKLAIGGASKLNTE